MRILLTNDDGIDAPGIIALEKALSPRHEVWVVAPGGERSGMSHTITLKGPISFKNAGARRLACSGSPADCVSIALHGDFIPKADVVISGINRGPNLGTDLLYSGTAGGARQAALMNVPGIATSLAVMIGPFNYQDPAAYVAENLESLIAHWKNDHFINLNFPGEMKTPWTTALTHPCRRHYSDTVVSYVAPDGERFCFIEGFLMEGKDLKGSDWHAVNQGLVALSPVAIHPVNIAAEAYHQWKISLEEPK